MNAINQNRAPLAKRAMIFRLSISTWGNQRKDRKATDQVHKDFGASADSGLYRKNLVAPVYLAPVKTAVSALRSWHDFQTLPWKDNGLRLLPTVNHDYYMAGYRERLADWEKAVDRFVAGFPGHVEQARAALNGLFNESDYPAPAELRRRFEVNLGREPFPAVEDWRLDNVSDMDMDRIRAEARADVLAAVEDAQREAWARLREHVDHIAKKLSIPAGAKLADGTTGQFHDSMIDNLRALVDVLPRLNIGGDPALDAFADECRNRLAGLQVETLRSDGMARARAAVTADDILQRMAGYTGGQGAA